MEVQNASTVLKIIKLFGNNDLKIYIIKQYELKINIHLC